MAGGGRSRSVAALGRPSEEAAQASDFEAGASVVTEVSDFGAETPQGEEVLAQQTVARPQSAPGSRQ